MKRLNIVATAYACEPWQGSEPGIGWNIVKEISQYHDITVVTRPNNKVAIDKYLQDHPIDGLRFEYYDPPRWATRWKKGTRGLFAYYYWWQIGAYRVVKDIISQQRVDLVHHVTFGRYWSPSFLYRTGLPVVWGPVGGGESTPSVLMPTLSFRGRLYERARSLLRALGERDPFVRKMASKSEVILATTEESKDRITRLGGKNIVILGNAALDRDEVEMLASLPENENGKTRFVSIGRMLHWKGFHLGLEAFAKSGLTECEYWLIGNGPAEDNLKQQAAELGLEDRIKFTGKLSRDETLDIIAKSHVLVHPSFHDSGGWVCIEAMSAGKPVIALNLGGPALMVNGNTGRKIDVHSPEQVVADIARAMVELADDGVREGLSEQSKRRALHHFTWQRKGAEIAELYNKIVSQVNEGEPRPVKQLESLEL